MEKNNMIDSFSFSGISTFKTCPGAFKYKYIEQLPEAFSSIEAYMGTSVHAVLEWAYQQRLQGSEPGIPEAMEQYKQTFWNSGELEQVKVIKTGFTVTDYFDRGKTFITFFLNHIFPRDNSTTLHLEHKFEIHLAEEIKYRGVIDRVARGADGMIRVIDYKTGRTGPPLDTFQLPAYALYIFENNKDNEIQLCIEDLREQRTLGAIFHRDETKQVRSALFQDIRQILETKEFHTNPSMLCLWCGYNHICDNPHESVKDPEGYRQGRAVPFGETGGCCPQCGGELLKRNGKYGPFMGCANFPQCRYTQPIRGG
jgi:RecB family exonuclease